MVSPSFLLLSFLCLELPNVNCQSKILVHCLNNAVQDTLQNLVHIADIVVSGRVQQLIEGGSKGTQVATVYYYYAYKWNVDVLNNDGVIKIYNVPPMPTVSLLQSSAFFFLVQEPDGILALLCYSALTSITMYRVIKNGGDISTNVNIDDLLLSVLDKVEEVGLSKFIKGWMNILYMCVCRVKMIVEMMHDCKYSWLHAHKIQATTDDTINLRTVCIFTYLACTSLHTNNNIMGCVRTFIYLWSHNIIQ